MEARFDGKRREDVLGKACQGDHSIIYLKLAEEKKTSKRCRSRCLICSKVFSNGVATVIFHLKSRAHQAKES